MATGSLAQCLVLATAFFGVCTALGLALGYAFERFNPRRVWALPLTPGQTAHEFKGNLVFLTVVSLGCALVWWSGLIRWQSGWLRGVLTFVAFSVVFQAYYYALHRLMHHRSVVRFHRWHHESRVTTPLSGQSVGAVEAVGWAFAYAGLPLLMSLLTPVSFWGVVSYLAFNVIGNIAGHANVEVVPPSPSLWQRSTVSTVFTYHALHHARWTGHYGFASTWADRLWHTEWKDWPALHRKVWSGSAMTSLKERGEESSSAS